PFGFGGGGVGVEVEATPADVDSAALVVVEGGADGGVVDGGITGGHLGSDMTQHLLNDMLGDPLVDHPGSHSVSELVEGDSGRLAGLVVEADAVPPHSEPGTQCGVAERSDPVRVGVR